MHKLNKAFFFPPCLTKIFVSVYNQYADIYQYQRSDVNRNFEHLKQSYNR